MKIKCGNCSVDHELEPPAWVMSSGRAFRFRCSSCGVSQMVQPQGAGNTPPTTPAGAPAPVTSSAASSSPAEPAAASAPNLPTAEVPRPPSEQGGGAVYLKQDGKVYLIKDWSTVQRWIMERRVERSDLVSEGGVRWEPIGSRPELGSFFAAVDRMEAVDRGDAVAAPEPVTPAPAPAPSPFAGMGDKPSGGLFGGNEKPPGLFGSDSPFPFGGSDAGDAEGSKSRFARLDDDTEGVPMGLPDLPTEDGAGADDEGVPTPRRFVEASLTPDDEARLEARKGEVRAASPLPASPFAASDDEGDFAMAGNTPAPAPDRASAAPEEEFIAAPAMPTPAPAPTRAAALPEPRAGALPELRAEPMFARLPPAGSEPSPAPTERLIARPKDEPKPSGPPSVPPEGPDPFDQDFPAFPKEHTDEAWGEPAKKPRSMAPLIALGVVTLIVAIVVVIGVAGTVISGQNRGKERDDVQISDALPPVRPPEAKPPVVPVAPPETKTPEVPPETKAPEIPPETKVPETKAPETKAPETKAPETKAPETKAPETKAPPTPPKPPSVSVLVDKGWKLVDAGKYSDAAASFEKALAQNGSHPDATLGFGYASLKLGRKDDATKFLCRAQEMGGSSGAEAKGMIASNDLSCP